MKYFILSFFFFCAVSLKSQFTIKGGVTNGFLLGFQTNQDYITSGVYAGLKADYNEVKYAIIYKYFFSGKISFTEQVLAIQSTTSPEILMAEFDMSHQVDDVSILSGMNIWSNDKINFNSYLGLGYFSTTQLITAKFNTFSYYNPYQFDHLRSVGRIYTTGALEFIFKTKIMDIDLKGYIYAMDSILGLVSINFRNQYFLNLSLGASKTF